jgi:hypothetical protein
MSSGTSAVGEQLTEVVEFLEQHDRQPRCVDELERSRHQKVVDDGVRETVACRAQLAAALLLR